MHILQNILKFWVTNKDRECKSAKIKFADLKF